MIDKCPNHDILEKKIDNIALDVKTILAWQNQKIGEENNKKKLSKKIDIIIAASVGFVFSQISRLLS